MIKVIIVDDIPETREHLSRLLGLERDLDVAGTAGTGEEAIKVAMELRPDVIVMDINMPGMDGVAAAEIISQRLPTSPIIMMSVHGEAMQLKRAISAGAREFLVKPFSGDEFSASIRTVFEREIARRSQVDSSLPAVPTPVNPSEDGEHQAGAQRQDVREVEVVQAPAEPVALLVTGRVTPVAWVDEVDQSPWRRRPAVGQLSIHAAGPHGAVGVLVHLVRPRRVAPGRFGAASPPDPAPDRGTRLLAPARGQPLRADDGGDDARATERRVPEHALQHAPAMPDQGKAEPPRPRLLPARAVEQHVVPLAPIERRIAVSFM